MTQAQSDQTAEPLASGPYTVTAYQRANVRRGPRLSEPIVSFVVANESYGANCWTNRDTTTIHDNGVTNDIWIQLPLNAGGVGYVSAVYLRGDERANLPRGAACG
jgi:hypothetical protein